MSGYHRIFKLKGFLSSIRNLKNINKINDSLTKEIDDLCSKNKVLQDSSNSLSKLKELNQFLSKEFGNKSLYSVQNCLEDKKDAQHKRKFLKPRHLKKEIEKLCKHLKSGQVLGGSATFAAASGLSLRENVTTETIFENFNQKVPASVLDKDIDSPQIFKKATISDINSDYFVVKTGKYAETDTSFPFTEISSESLDTTDPIPEPPLVPDWTAESINQLNALGEPTFASLGLGGSTPVGILQSAMEYLHATVGLEWWATIVLSTLIIRICLFPLVILAQRNAAKMNNIMPQMQLLQMKITEARQTGDSMGAARYSQELMVFMREKGVNPFKNMLVPLAQAPIFLSFFMGLRQMANVPVDSLRTGGVFWFTDLTLPDQFYLMPVITSLTLWATIEVGADAGRLSAQNAVILKYFLRAMPIIIIPFTMNFPGAILCYWVSSNFVSLIQVSFLRIPKVRDYFKIERMVTFTPDQLPTKPKGFTEGVKDSWTNLKLTRELDERQRLDEMQFKRAGKGPLQKTFKYDPTKLPPSGGGGQQQAAISAKKRS
ncbi:unnamed protein product [Ceutorhynchus assimilis]|uniref:Membrane insertase YidC/Oxa/ALB C-terminal domain-containing protein n=1 Tax=Ceutorhynchus assimilis TaxID=467358 RepID=A0A9P0GQ64_9CUCU|nr:unnamed protein product [Ceutorhynchus assimilis]